MVRKHKHWFYSPFKPELARIQSQLEKSRKPDPSPVSLALTYEFSDEALISGQDIRVAVLRLSGIPVDVYEYGGERDVRRRYKIPYDARRDNLVYLQRATYFPVERPEERVPREQVFADEAMRLARRRGLPPLSFPLLLYLKDYGPLDADTLWRTVGKHLFDSKEDMERHLKRLAKQGYVAIKGKLYFATVKVMELIDRLR